MIDRDIFIAPPIEASPKNKLQKLEKCVYSLNDAACTWVILLYGSISNI